MMTLEGVDDVLTEKNDTLPPCDYHCPLLSLPLRSHDYETIAAQCRICCGFWPQWSDFSRVYRV